MPCDFEKCSKIHYIVRLRQLLQRWRNKARISAAAGRRFHVEVPLGHVAVCVGSTRRRFVVHLSHLNHPLFKNLLSQAEEEYGFTNQDGPLVIPCEESVFKETVRFISLSDSSRTGRFTVADDGIRRNCYTGVTTNLDLWSDSRPLLHDLRDNTIW